MGKQRDLTGMRFGKLVAIEPTDERQRGSVVWRCVCDCGGEKLIAAIYLVGGSTKSCGCLNNLTGRRFGWLTAIEPTEERRYGCVAWKCICDCGTEKLVASMRLVSGSTKSCGCERVRDLTGQRFGKLTAIEPTRERSDSSVKWRCVCDCGNEKLVSGHSLVRGDTKSCGCLRGNTLKPDEIVFE